MIKPYYETKLGKLYCGDVLDVLRQLPDGIVQTCITSPPYWGLRDYGVSGQLGLEETPELYVEKMVNVFREVRRVLKDDGTLWLNLGDSYAAGKCGRADQDRNSRNFDGRDVKNASDTGPPMYGQRKAMKGLKPKDLCGIPWRVAFALQADGWYLRQDIIWHKPNPMPESVKDRCTKAHEYIFLMSKNGRYFYDLEAVKEPVTGNAHSRGNGVNPKAKWETPDGWDTSKGNGGHGSYHKEGREKGYKNYKHKVKQNESFSAAVCGLVDSRNRRSVWTIATQPYPEAHFATFPPKLIEPCIFAGSKEGDIVLDPFGGSGTTGEQCEKYGRKWVLIDISEDYCGLSAKRIEQEASQMKLW